MLAPAGNSMLVLYRPQMVPRCGAFDTEYTARRTTNAGFPSLPSLSVVWDVDFAQISKPLTAMPKDTTAEMKLRTLTMMSCNIINNQAYDPSGLMAADKMVECLQIDNLVSKKEERRQE